MIRLCVNCNNSYTPRLCASTFSTGFEVFSFLQQLNSLREPGYKKEPHFITSLDKIFERTFVNTFLPISFNICFDKEPSH